MISRIQRFILSCLVVGLVASSVSGCRHTARGAGKDIENMGEKIQDKTQ